MHSSKRLQTVAEKVARAAAREVAKVVPKEVAKVVPNPDNVVYVLANCGPEQAMLETSELGLYRIVCDTFLERVDTKVGALIAGVMADMTFLTGVTSTNEAGERYEGPRR